MDYRPCAVCGGVGTERHHIIPRSHCRALIHCEKNLVVLCPRCHRGRTGVHQNRELDLKLKLEFQNELEMLFDKEYLTEDEINSVLEIGPTALKKLLKTLKRKPEGYFYLDVLRVCMGGRLYE